MWHPPALPQKKSCLKRRNLQNRLGGSGGCVGSYENQEGKRDPSASDEIIRV